MAKRNGSNVLYLDIPEPLKKRLRKHCRESGSKMAQEVRVAIERHLDYPVIDQLPRKKT